MTPAARIRIVGTPGLLVDGVARPLAGRKPWAIVGYLALGNRPTRRELAELLFAEAADPLAAERWALLQVRRALAGLAEVSEPGQRLTLTPLPGTAVDAALLLAGRADAAALRWIEAGELLATVAVDDAPAFEQWLTLERHRVSSALVDALRRAAVDCAGADPAAAIGLVERAIALEPFDDSLHELAVDLRVSAGDLAGAQTYLAALERRYARDLGVPIPDRIRRPLERPVPAAPNPLVDLRGATAALLELARARHDAGDYAGAIEAARRAARDAAASGDPAVECAALGTLASVLVHAVRGRDDEAVALLERALRLATDARDTEASVELERELGYVRFLGAEYGAAEAALRRSFAAASAAGDDARAGRALTLLAATASDRGDHALARTTLAEARALLARAGDRRWDAYALSFRARAELWAGEPAAARATGNAAVQAARASGWSSLVPWCQAQEAEAALALGDRAAAAALFGHAFSLGCEIGDPCWESVALRGLALVARAEGRPDDALALLRDAHARALRSTDTYRWAVALVLTDLVVLERARDPERLAAALALTASAPMADLYARLAPFAAQTGAQTAGA